MADIPKTFLQDHKKMDKKAIILVGSVALIFLVAVLFLMSSSKRVKRPAKPKASVEERRDVYSKTEIENLIKGQIAEEMEKTDANKPKETSSERGRKLGSPIAVFIKKENVPETEKTQAGTKQYSEIGIPLGTKIKAFLSNAIFSFNIASPVVAITDEDVSKDGKVIIPRGTQFIGEAGIVKSRDRVNIQFASMVMPDGRETRIRAMALSQDGSGGIKGKVDKQLDKSVLKAAGEILLGGAALVVGTSNRAMTLEDELRLNAARNLTDDARGALSQVRPEESIRVEAYTPILVLILESF